MKHLPTLKDAQTVPNVCAHCEIRHLVLYPVEVSEHVTGCITNRKSKTCTRSGKRSLKAFDTGLMTGDGWVQLTGHGPRDEAPLEMIYAAYRFRDSLPLSPSPSCTISLTIITSYGAQIIYQKCSNLHILYTCTYVRMFWVRECA